MEIIVNPEAGHGLGRRKIAGLKRLLSERGLAWSIVETERPGHATSIAQELARANRARVAVMGGDGTISEVVNGLMGSEVELGIIPVGTGNDIVRSLGLPLHDMGRALEIIHSGKTRQIDVGLAGDRFFVSVLGVGFPVQVAAAANKMRGLKGSSVFFLAMYKALSKMKARPVTVQLDETRLAGDLSSVLIQNTPYTGGGLRIAPNAVMNDGLLDVLVVDNIGRLRLMLNLPKLYSGTHRNHPNFSMFRSSTVRISAPETQPLMFDGDVFGQLPVETSTWKRALKVIVAN